MLQCVFLVVVLTNALDTFVYRINDEIDGMSIEYLWAYEKSLLDGWKDLINHEEEHIGSVCKHTIAKHFVYYSSNVFVNLDPHHCHVRDVMMKTPCIH